MQRLGKQNLVSVIVPIYNAAKYLSQCLDSITNQTYKEIELILIDDGSTDGCYEICERYKQQDKRIRVLHKKNEGLVCARKTGFKMAQGEFLTFIDADDWIEPDMLEQFYKSITEQNVDVVITSGRFEDTGAISRRTFQGVESGKYNKIDLLHRVYPRMIVNQNFFEWGVFPGVCDKMFRRERLEPYLMDVDERIMMGEDAACVYPCLLNVDSIYIIGKCLYHYRQSLTSMVRQKNQANLERKRFSVLYHSVMKFFEKNRNIYDLTEQWKLYVLFLMTPRADTLYYGMDKLDYLFPFPKVQRGSRIILYGMGTYGQRLYHFLKETEFCQVVLLVDKNYLELRKQGFPVEAVEKIEECEYDAIVIASSFANTRRKIYEDLTARFIKEKVHVMDEELIKSEETLKAFGLYEGEE